MSITSSLWTRARMKPMRPAVASRILTIVRPQREPTGGTSHAPGHYPGLGKKNFFPRNLAATMGWLDRSLAQHALIEEARMPKRFQQADGPPSSPDRHVGWS